jgi:hypothetical protein
MAMPAPASAPSHLVFFDWDKADLTDRARQVVSESAASSTKVRYTRIGVIGYTDTSGSPRYNQGLSVRRAFEPETRSARPRPNGAVYPLVRMLIFLLALGGTPTRTTLVLVTLFCLYRNLPHLQSRGSRAGCRHLSGTIVPVTMVLGLT